MIRTIRHWFRKDHYYTPVEQAQIVFALMLDAAGLAMLIIALVEYFATHTF